MAGEIKMGHAELKRLTKNDSSFLESKNIYLAGFSSANIEYFIECFHEYVKKICGVFAVLDIDERTPLSASVGEKVFDIKPLAEVRGLDSSADLLVIMYEYEKEAYEKIRSIRGDKPLSVYWLPDKKTAIELEYREKYKGNVSEDVILFKSGSRQYVYGEDFSDNARALFEYMLKYGYNKRWELVWLVYQPENQEYDIWKQYENVEFIGAEDGDSEDEEKRERYYKYLCSAKYAFATDDEIFFRRRRGDQILIQLWHGDGVKGRTRFRVMEKRWDYMVCTSRFYADSDEEVFGLRQDQLLPSGLPKDDWIFSDCDDMQWFKDQIDGFEHRILWGPTFRKTVKGLEMLDEKVELNETGLPIAGTWNSCDQLNETLRSLNCLLLIKLHPVADLSIHEGRACSNIRLMANQDLYSKGLHINHIMSYFDAFISDYSSAVTSYMSLDRPMAFTLDDLDEYDDSRGFVFEPIRDYLPGEELYTLGDMVRFIDDVCSRRDRSIDKRRKLISMMIDHRDGRNSERLLRMLSIEK